MSVEMDVVYQGDLHCSAIHGPSGQTLSTDAPVDNGGRGESFSPTDLVATALAACVVTIMGIVAKKSGLDIEGTKVHVIKEMVNDPVRRIGALKMIITYPKGKPISPTDRMKLEKAAQICPVKQSLHPDINISIEYVVPE